MQNQTTYVNFEGDDCEPPRGHNATAIVSRCRMGQGEAVYSYDEGGTVFRVNGCDYSFVGYAPCVPDEAKSTSTVQLEGQINCTVCPTNITDPQGFNECVINFHATKLAQITTAGITNSRVEVVEVCNQPTGNGFMLARDTANRRLEDGPAKYAVIAEQKTECGDSCANQDFSATEAALVEAISKASPGSITTGSSSVTELASTG